MNSPHERTARWRPTTPIRVPAGLVWLRASVVGAIALALGSLAHVTAGGLLPSSVALFVLAGFLTALVAPVLTSPASYRLLFLLVGGGQAAVHLVLTATAGHAGPHRGPTAVVPAEELPQRTGGVPDLLAVAPDQTSSSTGVAPHWAQHLIDDLSATNGLMTLAHLVAAAGVAFWLWRGEQALWTLIALLARRYLEVPAPAAAGQVALPRAVVSTSTYLTGSPSVRWLRVSVSRRGPPRSAHLLASPR